MDLGAGAAVTARGASQDLPVDESVRLSYFVRRLADVVPNPWHTADVARRLLERLRETGAEEAGIHDRRSHLASALREAVIDSVERMAERVFRDKLAQREIRFDLDARLPRYRMRESFELPVAESDRTLQRRQFDTELERRFACYLDERKAIRWWHRVAVRQQGEYHLHGWRRERIYPDFLAMAGEISGKPHLLVFETKGEHLRDNPDTTYKHKVLETLERAFNVGRMQVRDGPAKGAFRLIFNEAEFPQALSNVDHG